MALERIEGWDLYGTASDVVVGNWEAVGGTPVLNSTGGKLNGKHVSLNSTSDFIRAQLITQIFNSGNHFLGFHFKIDTLQTAEVIRWTDENNNDSLHSFLELQSDGSFDFKQGNLSTVLASSAPGIISAGAWYTIECRMKPSSATFSTANADGEFELRINGTVRINATNLSIGPFDTSSPRPVGLGKFELRGSAGVNRFDDIYAFNDTGSLNTSFAGDFRVQTLRPASDTATASWTAVNAGAHFEEVDEDEPDGDTSYVSSQETNAADIYELTDLTGDIGTILGYSPLVLAKREIGSTQNIAIRMIGSSETVDFSAKNLADSYEYRFDLRSGSVDDPTNSTPPDVAEVNALQAGIFIP